MALALIAVIGGLILLVWSADRFVDGAAATARIAGMPPLLIGMLIVGFGTSAPEMVVSAFSALAGNPGLALGNAYGSNIANIALILGLVSLMHPVLVHSQVIRRELPVLTAITLLSAALIWDGNLSRLDAWILLALFALAMGWSIYDGFRTRQNRSEQASGEIGDSGDMTLAAALFWLVIGLVMLVVSSRALVWGAVSIAQGLGVDDLIIGLTIVALGTSLPELASSISAARKGEHDIALGNVLGSNLFNTLAVVGIAGAIQPMQTAPELLYRDWSVMTFLTVSIFLMGYGFRGPGRISRWNGAFLLLVYVAYMAWLVLDTFEGAPA